ncbi:MAG TPA: Rieske 2Fe-2S domain-containing protein [Rhizomicrobium sp.]|nr:Rieske 2Fe-2S domain-containing protein [Rhizomicrobium sp.]
MWTATGITEAGLKVLGRKLVRKAGKQILLIAREGRVFAIANRCPHEGYPLSEGTEGPGCVLTCNWHNWKFDLATGAALVGRDPVRTYPVSLRDGEIFLDLADLPAEAQRERALKGLEAALLDNDASRMARETARLERAGFDAEEALVHALGFLGARLEDGATHAHGAAADWLALAGMAQTPQARLTAILEPIQHLAWDTQGAPEFAYADGVAPWNERDFLDAIEAERETDAVALVRGALAGGHSLASLRPVFAEAALAHYADFGHSAIYTVNLAALDTRLGGAAREALMLALTRSLVRATREDRLPEFRGYAKALAAWDGTGTEPARAEDFIGLSVDAILPRTLASSARPAREIYDALLGAAAFNLLHFDVAFMNAADNAIADNIGWLDFTHALTFAGACRALCEDDAGLWPTALLQLALFVGRNRKYVNPRNDTARWHVPDAHEFLSREIGTLYDHGIPEPIIACHRLKVLFALRRELEHAPSAPWTETMCAGVNRYLAIQMKRHNGLRNASQALDFIAREG